jgi:hypothetical protein
MSRNVFYSFSVRLTHSVCVFQRVQKYNFFNLASVFLKSFFRNFVFFSFKINTVSRVSLTHLYELVLHRVQNYHLYRINKAFYLPFYPFLNFEFRH